MGCGLCTHNTLSWFEFSHTIIVWKRFLCTLFLLHRLCYSCLWNELLGLCFMHYCDVCTLNKCHDAQSSFGFYHILSHSVQENAEAFCLSAQPYQAWCWSHHLEQRAESREATSLRHSFLFSLWNQYQARYEEEGGSLDWTHKVVPRSVSSRPPMMPKLACKANFPALLKPPTPSQDSWRWTWRRQNVCRRLPSILWLNWKSLPQIGPSSSSTLQNASANSWRSWM